MRDMVHELKILPAFFEAVLDGRKNFEVRDNRDRGFQAGDMVCLREWVDRGYRQWAFSGRSVMREITYVTNFEQKEGFVVFGMKETTDD